MTVKLLWWPSTAEYRLHVFAGPTSQRRAFAGELVLQPAEAAELHHVLELGVVQTEAYDVTEVGWVQPVPSPA